ncbi:hypothetical protein [Pseudomonas mangrovi]|uniref:Uncharacterized protein n=1 Tax=Pseudomonas mangrovi TaxID=2161748 RepID=A0A2T5PEA6_9PSED|nr:hypothetical protein [Pseudomonas mangrovi]PTU76075.1 hypothetical protein DBO85_00090 [Pseudomonas mangrovi]
MFLLNITALFVRIFGIYMLLLTFLQQRGIYSSLGAIIEDPSLLNLATPAMAITGFLALIMIVFPVSIARMLLPRTSSESPSLSSGAHAIEVCAFTVLGVYILSRTLPDLLHNLIYLIISAKHPSLFGEADRADFYVATGVTLFEIAIGTYVALGAKKLSTLLNTLRTYGHKK